MVPDLPACLQDVAWRKQFPNALRCSVQLMPWMNRYPKLPGVSDARPDPVLGEMVNYQTAWYALGSVNHGTILNVGNAAAFDWLINHVDGVIWSQGLDWYREDMNGEGPLPAWRGADAPDRQGITENFYVQGHLAFWDELRRRHPALRIDSCASGGRRNDLETMRRAVPLLRSDFQFPSMKGVVEGNQGQTLGLCSWLPFQGRGCYLYEPHACRKTVTASPAAAHGILLG